MRLHTPPSDIGKAGIELWRSVLSSYRLTETERVQLANVCRQADFVASLEEAIAEDGLMVTTKSGTRKIHPAVAALSAARSTYMRLLVGLKLPPLDANSGAESGRSQSQSRSDRARRAAVARWHPEAS